MYRGPVEQDGSPVTEEAVADAVAKDSGFWEYVAKQVEAGRIPEQPSVWRFRLAVSFQNSDGSNAVLDESGSTSRVTEQSFEFYRSGQRAKETDAVATLAVAVSQLAKSQAEERAATSKAAGEMAGTIASAVQQAMVQVLDKTMSPLTEMVKILAERGKRDEERFDGIVVDLFNAHQPAAQTSSGFGMLRDLIGIAGEAKKLMN
jgi:hypothetical protein